MLGKLMKYELKATSRLLVPLFSILLVMSLINRFVFQISDDGKILGLFNQFLVVTYIITIFAVLIVTSIYMIVRFYKNLLTDEGYLMFTLPVKTHELITSKLLINMFWTVISFAVVLLSLFIAFATPDNLHQVFIGMKEVFAQMNRELGGSGTLLCIEFIFMFIFGLVSNVLLVYVSIAIGQQVTKHKIIGSFAAYMVIYMALQFLSMLAIIPFGYIVSNTQPDPSIVPKIIFPISILILIAGCAACYFVTNYMFKRKLNLD